MYTKSAKFYDQLYDFKDYGAAVEELREYLQRLLPNAKTLLDVACGTGRHLEHLGRHFQVEGLDINEQFVGMARRRCPGATFHQLDMTAFDLGRTFDVVTCLFSAVAYVKSVENLRYTVANLARHANPGGIV